MKILLMLAAVLWAAPVRAQVAKLDLTPLLKDLGVCSVVTQHGDVLAGGCYTAASWAWGSGQAGVLWDTNEENDNKGVGGAFVAMGIRADKAFGWAWNRTGLAGKVALHFVVPAIELGPMGGYGHRFGWVCGGFVNGKWPFGGAS